MPFYTNALRLPIEVGALEPLIVILKSACEIYITIQVEFYNLLLIGRMSGKLSNIIQTRIIDESQCIIYFIKQFYILYRLQRYWTLWRSLTKIVLLKKQIPSYCLLSMVVTSLVIKLMTEIIRPIFFHNLAEVSTNKVKI